MNTQTNSHTITALFDKRAEAMQAVEELVRAGVPRPAVRISPESDVGASTTTTTSYDASRDEKGFWASLGDLFMPDEDRYTYAEALNRGSVMVSVSVSETSAALAEDILEKHGTVNVEEREAAWRKDGWSGYTAPVSGAAGTATAKVGVKETSAQTAALGPRDMADGDQSIQEVEEQLRVGKRQVASGRVKVRSYVVETPVSEQINLHSETVRVERRPVDGSMTVTEDAFRERTIEAVATSEEAVVSKEARVTGEVLVRKEVADRTETITDKVRSTKVEVEDDRVAAQAPVPPKRVP
ncbi:YsnF/AvaK domain-containing protein [uncultured Enterovirga sp.]|uniref:YsnF/AvaK domain-containing protein n=1 Tax=uncultured Enterovirga sp. TaxID=2026352 RepID=UPI0035CB06D5